MQKDEIKKEILSEAISTEIFCSKCQKILSEGEFYNKDIITKDVICIDCQDNRILMNSENFLSIEDK